MMQRTTISSLNAVYSYYFLTGCVNWPFTYNYSQELYQWAQNCNLLQFGLSICISVRLSSYSLLIFKNKKQTINFSFFFISSISFFSIYKLFQARSEIVFFCFLFFYRNFNIEFNFHSFLQNQFQLCLIYSNVIWWLLEQSYNVCLWGCKGDFWMLLFFLEADEKTVCVCVRARMCAYENLKNCLKYLFIRI